MIVRHGRVIAEGWWKPEAADKQSRLHTELIRIRGGFSGTSGKPGISRLHRIHANDRAAKGRMALAKPSNQADFSPQLQPWPIWLWRRQPDRLSLLTHHGAGIWLE
jgi:hypothetical protein